MCPQTVETYTEFGPKNLLKTIEKPAYLLLLPSNVAASNFQHQALHLVSLASQGFLPSPPHLLFSLAPLGFLPFPAHKTLHCLLSLLLRLLPLLLLNHFHQHWAGQKYKAFCLHQASLKQTRRL